MIHSHPVEDSAAGPGLPATGPYDALLLVSFGGPEAPDDVMPFLQNVVVGKDIPRQRLLEVARHYELFGGVSPLNDENRALLAALVAEFNEHGPQLSVYWGNRNWHPMLEETVAQMAEDGVKRALAFVTSPFGSHPGCRQYLDDIQRARQIVGTAAPRIDKLRLFYNHPGFIEPTAERIAAAFAAIRPERRDEAGLLFSAHSIPIVMAERCPYEHQLRETCRLLAERLGVSCWQLAFQSRSGPPAQPWLVPSIEDCVRNLAAKGVQDVVVAPIGFVMENMEVVYDLDVDVAGLCDGLGVNMIRADVVGAHPRFVRMIRELVAERFDPASTRHSLGPDDPWPDECPAGCCQR